MSAELASSLAQVQNLGRQLSDLQLEHAQKYRQLNMLLLDKNQTINDLSYKLESTRREFISAKNIITSSKSLQADHANLMDASVQASTTRQT